MSTQNKRGTKTTAVSSKNPQSNKKPRTNAGKLESILAISAISCIGVAVLCFFATLLIAAFLPRQALADGAIAILVWIGYFGLPIGFVLLFILLIRNLRGRAKAQTTR